MLHLQEAHQSAQAHITSLGTTHVHSESLVFQRIIGSISASTRPGEALDDYDGDTVATDSNTPCTSDQAEGCEVISGVEESESTGELEEDAPSGISTLLMSLDLDAEGTSVPV